MSKTVKRGYQIEDEKAFGDEAFVKLQKAAFELYFLLNRGYKVKPAIQFIGNHYLLSERQRLALARTVSSDKDCLIRERKQITQYKQLMEVHIDTFNIIITLEVILSGSPVFLSLDNTLRDLAGLRGSYRIIDKTEIVIHKIYQWLTQNQIGNAYFYLDAPVSNSGRLASLLTEIAKTYHIQMQTFVISDVDHTLEQKANVITSDSIILNRCKSWINMNRAIIEQESWKTWIIDLLGEIRI